MDTKLLKEEMTRIPIWVKLHDVHIQVFEEDGWSSFARCLIEVNLEADLVDVVTIGIPSLTGDDFTKETICVEYEWRPPRCDICKIFGHVHDHCPKKVVSSPIVAASNIVTPTVEKTNDGFQMVGKKKKRKGSASKNDNIVTSNSYSALNDEEEDVENVYDETANLFPNSISGGGSSFTVAAGGLMAFEQSSLKPGLQSMTSRKISSGLDLTYALSTITTQQPTERELDLLFKVRYDDYIGGQPSAAPRTTPTA
ncbi:zinc knuckle CX2CX4HX4C containing protein [Tanacetum coccineum]